MDRRAQIFLAELVGTAVLVIGGCGTAVFAAGNLGAFSGIGAFGVATAFGLSLLIMAYAIGHISGCHVNPAVTLGLVVAKKLDPKLLPVYWAGQFVGGLGAGGLLRLVFKATDGLLVPDTFASNGYGDYSPAGAGLTSVILVEVVMTAILIFVVLSTTTSKFPVGFGGIAAGFTLWLIHLISIPISNTSVNPARSLAVAPFAPDHGPLGQIWVFLIFPLVGGAIGALVHMVLNSGDDDSDELVGVETEMG